MDECLAYGICGLVIARTSASGGSDPVRVTDEHDIRICVETARARHVHTCRESSMHRSVAIFASAVRLNSACDYSTISVILSGCCMCVNMKYMSACGRHTRHTSHDPTCSNINVHPRSTLHTQQCTQTTVCIDIRLSSSRFQESSV